MYILAYWGILVWHILPVMFLCVSSTAMQHMVVSSLNVALVVTSFNVFKSIMFISNEETQHKNY